MLIRFYEKDTNVYLFMSGCQNEETRVLLRVMNREVRREITIYKSSCWQSFLKFTREKSDKPEKAFWSHLSRVYKSKNLPFSKLDTGHSLISNKREIVDILSSYYKNQFKIIETDKEDPKDVRVEEEYKIILNELSTSENKLEPTTAFEITKYIKKLKPKKIIWFSPNFELYDQIASTELYYMFGKLFQCLAERR